ncbi:MAG: hypothetical protein JXA23_04810, partial [Bacteroidales bacterium]|nr:hypothetical protein [Bacteroidales bacterium]
MKKKTILISSILLLLIGGIYSCKPGPEYSVPEILNLNEGWSFQMEGDTDRLPAGVPGCVHTDLLAN